MYIHSHLVLQYISIMYLKSDDYFIYLFIYNNNLCFVLTGLLIEIIFKVGFCFFKQKLEIHMLS